MTVPRRIRIEYQRLDGPLYGWRLVLRRRAFGCAILVGIVWQPMDNTPPWVPFRPDCWLAMFSLGPHIVWRWKRWPNRYGHAPLPERLT